MLGQAELKLYSACYSSKLFRNVHRPLETFKASKHIYSKLCSWNSVESFVDVLLDRICYNKDGLVVINKPYGVTVDPNAKKQILPDSYLLNTAVAGDYWYSLLDALPHIANELGYQSLSVIKSPGRYASGVTILSADEKITKAVKKSMNYSKVKDKVIFNHWMIVVGQPEPLSGSEKIGITLKEAPGSKETQVILENTWSKKSVKRKEVYPAFVEHTTLEKNKLCSLVQIKTSRTKWHLMRIYAAYLLSPVLGDNLYGGRVQYILGLPVAVSPYSDHAKLPQRLSTDLLAALHLKANESTLIPAHIHFKSLILRNYVANNEDLHIVAPLPNYFLWSCERLLLKTVTAAD